ncbi:MAG: hypothetical protein IAG10_11445, partial [Planctomycetaceae bacterium]|nr:hypothetical protein [Planctomycetaceae bacterium]
MGNVGASHSTILLPAGGRSAPVEVRRDPAAELRSAAQLDSWNDWLKQVARLTPKFLHAVGVFLFDPRVSQQPSRLWGLTFPAEGLSEDRRQSLSQIAEQAAATNQLTFGPFGEDAGHSVAAIKLPRANEPQVFLVVLESPENVQTDARVWLALVATSAELWSMRHDVAAVRQSPNAASPPPKPTNNWSRTQLGLALGVLAAVAMVIPVPYSVNCDCELQPVTRRFVAAPFEGALEKAFVEVGDPVQADQLLARMDGKEVRWEQAGNAAEYERAAKERDAHLADQEFGEAQLAKLQMERLALTTKLLEHRNERLEIRSPIDGIVVSGELKRAEGIRLAMGQSLRD